jgi:ABC-type transport system involved in Fe-S cluster assembly fused permease/ATPase subunit
VVYFFSSFPESPHLHLQGDIVFEDVHFTYPGATSETLHGISFTIKPQTKVAIVGDRYVFFCVFSVFVFLLFFLSVIVVLLLIR